MKQVNKTKVATFKKTLGANIMRLRVSNALSQQTLSRHLGVSQPHLSSIERGKGTLTALNYLRIAEYFGVPTKTLYKGAFLA